MDEDTTVRNKIRTALEEANDQDPPITTLIGFLEFVRDSCLVPKIYRKYEKIIADMWDAHRTSCLLSPSESGIRDNSDSEASFVSRDGPDHRPSLEADAELIDIFIERPNHPVDRSAYATCKQCSHPGSYIRADSMRNNCLGDEDTEFVVVQWKRCGKMDNSDDHAGTHTACRVVNKEHARSLGMDVDLVFGTDCKEELALQDYGVHVVRKAPKRPSSVVEEQGSQSSRLAAADASLSKQTPRIAPPRALIQPVFIFMNGIPDATTVIPNLISHLAGTYHPATDEPGNIVDPGEVEVPGSNIQDEPRKKRKVVS